MMLFRRHRSRKHQMKEFGKLPHTSRRQKNREFKEYERWKKARVEADAISRRSEVGETNPIEAWNRAKKGKYGRR